MKRLLIIPALLFTVAVSGNTGVSTEHTHEWRFRALLDDKPIGHHNFRLSGNGARRILDSQADFEVKLLFIKAYDYNHQASEQWVGNCLRRIQSTTDDNGTRYTVDGTLQGEELMIRTSRGRARLPGCVMSFAYWNPEILTQSRLLNTQTGDFVAIDVSAMGREPFMVGSTVVTAKRYRVTTAQGQRIDLWYSANDDHWLGLEAMTEDGYELRYELLNPPPQAVSLR